MPPERVYLPAGRTMLDELSSTGVIPAAPGSPRDAYAVTPALEQAVGVRDVEDLEYAAFCHAAEAAHALRSTPDDRRVVVAADADETWLSAADDGPPSWVQLTAPVPISRVAAFHIDAEPGAAAGDVGDLLWYDATELDEVLDHLRT